MNYLAHVYLAEQCADGLVGALLGDFVKGPVDCSLPAALARGIRLHRAIDRYTDDHPVHLRSRRRFAPPRRRFAGIIVDLCYDHFLCAQWRRRSEEPLPQFTARVYDALRQRHRELPPRLEQIVPRMVERDWLSSYADLERLDRALDGVASRLRRGERMRGAIEEVRAVYAGLEADFEQFFPDLVEYAARWKAASTAAS